MKILVVDDEQDLCEILQYNLETEGYEVVTANSAEEVLNNEACGVKNGELPDLILLDVMMGKMSGFQLARQLKDNPVTAQIPIIFITALDDEDNTVKGLNIGADDYMAKPLSMKEVKARVRAVMRRTQNPGTPSQPPRGEEGMVTAGGCLEYEGIVVEVEAKRVLVDEEEIQLTKLEFELLTLLLRCPNRVFSREELLSRCWPQDVYVLDRTVDVNITRLRKKIGRYGQQIKTRIGYGYCFEKA